jgi:hypothetical protein
MIGYLLSWGSFIANQYSSVNSLISFLEQVLYRVDKETLQIKSGIFLNLKLQ